MDHLAIKHGDDAIAQRASLRKLTPKNAIIVEIGSYVGITAISLLGDDRKIFCIDPWSDEKYASAGGGEYNRGWLIVFSTFCQNCGNNLSRIYFQFVVNLKKLRLILICQLI